MLMAKTGTEVIVTKSGLKSTGRKGIVEFRSFFGQCTVKLETGRCIVIHESGLSIPEPEKKPLGYYVFNETCRNSPKKTHETLEEAETEAKRLAGKQPAHTFSVLQIVSEFKAEVTVKQTK